MCSKRVLICVLLLLTGAVLPATCFGHKDVEQYAMHKGHPRHPSRRHRAANDGALRFEPEPYSKKLELNTAGKIHCKVAGGVSPNVQWFLNEADLLPDGITSVNGTLMISDAAKRHAGQYTCKATDGEHSITAKIQLDVVVSPRVLKPSPEQQVHVVAGSSAVLRCEASGDPEPTTHWDRNLTVLNQLQEGVEVEDGDNASNARIVLLNNGSLLIRGVSERDSDRYGCTAGSAAGLARNELFLVVHPEGEALPTESNGVGGKAVIVSISVAGAYMILVLALMLYCRRRRLKRRERGEKIELELAEGREKLVEEDEEKQKKLPNGTSAHNGRLLHDKDSGADNSEISVMSRASKKSGQYDHLAIPRNLVTDRITLGRGEFGEVQLGKVDLNLVKKHRNRGDSADLKIKPVLVKVLTSKDENILSEFRRQLEVLTRVKHENVSRLIGLCNDVEPHCMVIEHTDWGDLKTFLLSTRPSTPPISHRTSPLATRHQAALAMQLARANVPLAASRLTHRDIAARNCLITSHLQLKLSFPAMSRGPHSQEYYKLHDRVIPLRWLPLEAVSDGEYSTKSDVYMFAATVWEIYTQAELPFVKLNDNSVMERLKSSSLEWQVPGSMPEKLAELLKRCWSLSPADRPQFTEICEDLKTILQEIPNDQEEIQDEPKESEP